MAVADDTALAVQYRNILKRHGIPAVVRHKPSDEAFNYVLMVQSENYEQAYNLIASEAGWQTWLDPDPGRTEASMQN